MPSEPPVDPFEAAQFLMVGVITAIDAQTFHIGDTPIAAETSVLSGLRLGLRVEVGGAEQAGRRIARRVTMAPDRS